MRKLIVIFQISFLLFSCQTKENKKLNLSEPKKQEIDSTKSTNFVGTLENTIVDSTINYIYTPTLATAWNYIQDTLKNIRLDKNRNSTDFILLNNTKTNLNSLETNEFETQISISKFAIKAKSSFNLQLTFEPLFNRLSDSIYFKRKSVEGFGMIEWNENLAKQIKIIYYKDDDNFVFRIIPKEKNNELIFIKGLGINKVKSFKELLDLKNKYQALGLKEQRIKKLRGNYKLEEGDSFEIPELLFDIEKNFQNIVGQEFISNDSTYYITEAKQRNALLLNNRGVKVLSEAEIEVLKDMTDEPIKITKHLVLNDDFVLIINHRNKKNPYFCARIANTDLMNKQ